MDILYNIMYYILYNICIYDKILVVIHHCFHLLK